MREGEVGGWMCEDEIWDGKKIRNAHVVDANREVAIVLQLPYYTQRVICRPLILPSLILQAS
jgi:hypothetical protein